MKSFFDLLSLLKKLAVGRRKREGGGVASVWAWLRIVVMERWEETNCLRALVPSPGSTRSPSNSLSNREPQYDKGPSGMEPTVQVARIHCEQPSPMGCGSH